MFKGNRKPDFALGLILAALISAVFATIALELLSGEIFSSAGDQVNSRDNERATDYQQNGETKPKWWNLWGLIEWHDTAAQWLMMIFTIVAAGLLLGTLLVTQRMARVTQEMADQHTHIGKAQTRAYIAITKNKLVDLEVGKSPKIHLGYTNCGQTPAKNLSVQYNLDIIDSELTRVTLSHRTPSSNGTMGSGEKRDLRVNYVHKENNQARLILNEEFVNAIRGGNFMLRASGIIRYTDVFGKRRRTTFNFKTFPYEPNQIVIVPCKKGNRAS